MICWKLNCTNCLIAWIEFKETTEEGVFTTKTVKLRSGEFAFSEIRCMFALKLETAITSVVLLSKPKPPIPPLKTIQFWSGFRPYVKSPLSDRSETSNTRK